MVDAFLRLIVIVEDILIAAREGAQRLVEVFADILTGDFADAGGIVLVQHADIDILLDAWVFVHFCLDDINVGIQFGSERADRAVGENGVTVVAFLLVFGYLVAHKGDETAVGVERTLAQGAGIGTGGASGDVIEVAVSCLNVRCGVKVRVTGEDHVDVCCGKLLLNGGKGNHTILHIGDVVHIDIRLSVDMLHNRMVSHHKDVLTTVLEGFVGALFEEGHHPFGETACRLVSADIGLVGVQADDGDVITKISHIGEGVHTLVKAHDGIAVTKIGIKFGETGGGQVVGLDTLAA